jgi:hypothetical protein
MDKANRPKSPQIVEGTARKPTAITAKMTRLVGVLRRSNPMRHDGIRHGHLVWIECRKKYTTAPQNDENK